MEQLRECLLPTSRATIKESLEAVVFLALKKVEDLRIDRYEAEVSKVVSAGIKHRLILPFSDGTTMHPTERAVREALEANRIDELCGPTQQRIDQYFADYSRSRG